jgi:hypothetical protein
VELTVIDNELCDYKWEIGSGRVGLIKESHICVWSGEIEGPCNVSNQIMEKYVLRFNISEMKIVIIILFFM